MEKNITNEKGLLTTVLFLSVFLTACGGGGTTPPPTTYTIGGVTNGLTGSGLTLQNNGNEIIQVASSGGFVFTTAQTDGSSYSVQVTAQPSNPAQTCVVSNGTGVVSGADVNNVDINCTTNSYTVGGNVTGLQGTGLVLQNNSGDDLNISMVGSFTFASALLDGSTYNVTVAGQPDNHTCRIDNGNGAVAGAPVSDIHVHCIYNGPGDPTARTSRMQNTSRGSCDGILDYADELKPDQFELIRETDLGNGFAEIELTMQLTNLDRARFRSASVLLPVEANNPLGIRVDARPIPADFGAIQSYGSAASTATLQLQLPAANVAELINQIENGSLPVTVHADEEPVYPPGTIIRTWTSFLDSVSRTDGGFPLLPPEPPTDIPGEVHWIEFDLTDPSRWLPGPSDVPTYAGDIVSGYPEFDAGESLPGYVPPPPSECLVINDDASVFIVPGEDTLWSIPRWLHYVRVRSVCTLDDPITGAVGFGLWVERTTHDRLPEVVESGSFCVGPAQQVGLPVAATRVHSLDSEIVPDSVRDGNGQPIRFNFLPYWAQGRLTASGQIGCSVLKPQISFRIRDGRVQSGFGFESACSITAEMRAHDEVKVEEYEEPIEMWSHCFALPPLPLGTASIPMTLQLKHLIDVSAGASAGAVVGFTKQWDSGFSVSCESFGGEPASCTKETHRNPTPIEFTPPQLTNDTSVSLQAKTTFQAALRMGFEYPFCDLGAGITLDTSAYATAAITPTLNPWWNTTYGLDLVGGVDFGLYALGLVNVETDLFTVEDSVTANGPLIGSSAQSTTARVVPTLISGADQRWAVAIDDIAVPNGVDTTAIAALPDGTSFAIASEPIGGRSILVKLDRYGAYQWAKRYELGKTARRVRALADGTVIVAASNAYLSRHDTDGNVLWSFEGEVGRSDSDFGRCTLRDVVPIEQLPGVYDYVVVGIMGQATIQGSNDGCAFRVNADGSVPWAKVYGEDDVQYFLGATATRDGAIAVVGEVHGQLLGNRRFPLFAKINSQTGELIWWRALPMLRIARLNSVAEAPDGALYGVGGAQRIIWQTGAALVARIDADGSNARHGMLFQDFRWEDLFDFEPFAPLTAGETAYDEFFDIASMGDGFVVAGRTGLGVNTEAWVARIDKQLGVEWYRTFDGSSTDSLGGVFPVADGIFVSGYSASLPEPDGPNTGENQLWVMKLPFTGAVELLPETGVTARYIASGVRFSSDDLAVTIGLQPVETPTSLTIIDAEVLTAGPNPNAVSAATTICAIALAESGYVSTLDSCVEP